MAPPFFLPLVCRAALEDPSAPPILLWPSVDALTPAELLASRHQPHFAAASPSEGRGVDPEAGAAAPWAGRGGEGEAGAIPAAAAPLPPRYTLVVIDSTWSGAKRMHLHLPGPGVLPRVRLPPEAVGNGAKSLLAPVRAYAGDLDIGRVCTLEAVAAMLRELGEPQELVDALHENLRLKVDALRAQKGQESWYGTAGHGGRGPLRGAGGGSSSESDADAE